MKTTRTSRRRVLAGTAAMAAVGAFHRSVLAQGRTKLILRLNAPAYGEHAPFAVGLKKGFFAEQGIDLELREGQGSGNTIKVVASKADPIGYADVATAMKAIATGVPLRVVGVFQQKAPQAIVYFKERGWTSPKDLVGKSIALTAGDSIHQMMPAFFRKNGVDPNSVRLVFMEAAAKSAALIAGRVDSMGGFYTVQAAQIEAGAGKPTAWFGFGDHGVTLIAQGIMVHPDILKESPELVRRFLRAAVRSWQFADKNPRESVEALLERFPASAFLAVKNQGFTQWDLHRDLTHTDRSKGKIPGWVAMEDVDATLDLLSEFGGLKPRGKAADYVTNEFLPL